MRQTTPITIKHVIVAFKLLYEQVINALKAWFGLPQDWVAIGQQTAASHASWEQSTREVICFPLPGIKDKKLTTEARAGSGLAKRGQPVSSFLSVHLKYSVFVLLSICKRDDC